MSELVMQHVVPLLIMGLATGGAWLLFQLSKWVGAKWKESKMAQVLTKVTHFAGVIVQEIEATLRPEIKAALGDGKLTPEEAKRLKTVAMEKLKAMLGAEGLKELAAVVGVFAPTVDSYLSGIIEKEVATLGPK